MMSGYWDIRGNGRNAVVPCVVTPPDQNICGDLPGLFTNVLGGAMWIAEHPAIRQSLIQAEAETRALTGHQGAWHITDATDQPQIPSFVWLEQMPNKGRKNGAKFTYWREPQFVTDVYILRALHRRFAYALGRRFQKTLERRGVPVQEKEVVAIERLGGCRIYPLKNATTPNLPESSSQNQDGVIPGWRIRIDSVFLKDEEATRLSSGFIGWIVLICMMTRAYLNWPVKSWRGIEVIEALFYWARFFGFPVIIVCDLAKEFTDGVFPAFCVGWETSGFPHHIFIEEAIPYVKGQMGRTERANQIS
uniref:Integrase catalytic domain-containing protein n=1 Tax=Chromera velia CCMP2878 TaxID=1169474 RepID=A0A0G4F4K5_9ALVE|eukprot:Cvel_2719.t1-p1 / transcript=Cvel_2719.t1 / gene=Cvel_2719 / organism=Chromera_velia_CCMP2878 / gene_product=hypothetical protein / transcript_product=hypothetical protein / location=Cvel_scaffold109:33135-34367(+) / protein_length=304 / sequence_SO=supercontig / SO=protein_coding / is_pseudo=false